MLKKYSKEEVWKLYRKLPQELREAIFAEETANNIYNICERNGVESNQISEVARCIGRVLLGILHPDDLQKTLEEDLKVKKDTAKQLTREAFRFVFYPVKTYLEELYKTEFGPSPDSPVSPSTAKESEERPTGRERKDSYRESID